MSKKNILAFIIVQTCFTFHFFAQNAINYQTILTKRFGSTTIQTRKDSNTPAFIQFKQSIDTARLVELQTQLLGERSEDSWGLIRRETDQMGMIHQRFQQLYKGLPVEGQVFVFHSQGKNLAKANGSFIPEINLSVDPTISASAAFQSACTFAQIQVPFYETKLVVVEDDKNSLKLAYKCAVFSRAPLYNQLIYVDAQTGSIIKNISKLCAADVNGLGHTQFSGNKTITTDSVSSTQYLLQETGRGNGIVTLRNSNSLPYEDTDNDWNNVNATLDEFAVDAHWGAEVTYDFFMNKFGRNSFDNNGGVILSYVNDVSVGVNAYWSGFPNNEMHYGNGNGSYFPLTSLDIAGHEMAHGVTEYSADLIYAGESGALNESFSDIFGNTIRFLNAPAVATWKIGDQISRSGNASATFRNMENPNQYENADCYGGLFFNAGDIVHYDSGIQNFWYYLLCEGGSGVNDLSYSYSVDSIGMDDASQIAYRNLAFYLNPSSTFLDARNGSIQAAIDLFGLCSPQHKAVVQAWFAVGVGANTTGYEIEANFTSNTNFSCSAPLTVQFTGEGNYESYAWDFGDGTNSSVQNPNHVYNSNGSYAVTLIVSNTILCAGADTLVFSNYVSVGNFSPISDFSTNDNGATAPISFIDETAYGPTSWFWNFGDGSTSTLQNPTHVYTTPGTYSIILITTNCAGVDTLIRSFVVDEIYPLCLNTNITAPSGSIYDSGGPAGNYSNDEFCSIYIHPCGASSLTLQMEQLNFEPGGGDLLKIYNGTSASGTLLATYNGSNLLGPVTAPSGRMYIRFISNSAQTASGFKAKYTSTAPTNPPVANFSVSDITPFTQQSVSFQDLSTNTASVWNWNFGDGTSSTVQNPNHTYTSPGVYSAKLIVGNCNTIGNDTMVTTITVESGLGLNEDQQVNQLTVYPNPTSNQLSLHFEAAVQELEIKLLDLSGRVVYEANNQSTLKSDFTISANHLSNGNYVLQTIGVDGSGRSFSQFTKVVVQK